MTPKQPSGSPLVSGVQSHLLRKDRTHTTNHFFLWANKHLWLRLHSRACTTTIHCLLHYGAEEALDLLNLSYHTVLFKISGIYLFSGSSGEEECCQLGMLSSQVIGVTKSDAEESSLNTLSASWNLPVKLAVLEPHRSVSLSVIA